jgi:hypothetical protein
MKTHRAFPAFMVPAVVCAPLAFADTGGDSLAHRPTYLLKEGTVGTPRQNVPWIRVYGPAEYRQIGAKPICEITAVVVRSFEATNPFSHTEYIAEVKLQDSKRPVFRCQDVVIHGDRWNDLLEWHEANPFSPGSVVTLEVGGNPQSDASTVVSVLKICAKGPLPPPASDTHAAGAPVAPPPGIAAR